MTRQLRQFKMAKIAGIKIRGTYNQQHSTNLLCAAPANFYGPEDNYDLQNSHVLPTLLRKIHEAKVRREPQVVICGSGEPLWDLHIQQ